jgi:hypothetical protein
MDKDDIFEVLLDNLVTFCRIPQVELRQFVMGMIEIREYDIAKRFPVAVQLLDSTMEGHVRKVCYLIHQKLIDEGATWHGYVYRLGPNFQLSFPDRQLCTEELSTLWRLANAGWDAAKALTNILRVMRALKKRTDHGHMFI